MTTEQFINCFRRRSQLDHCHLFKSYGRMFLLFLSVSLPLYHLFHNNPQLPLNFLPHEEFPVQIYKSSTYATCMKSCDWAMQLWLAPQLARMKQLVVFLFLLVAPAAQEGVWTLVNWCRGDMGGGREVVMVILMCCLRVSGHATEDLLLYHDDPRRPSWYWF